jgi:hypothetical protein
MMYALPPTPQPQPVVVQVKVTGYTDGGPSDFKVKLSTGRTVKVRACLYEDSERCYWDAKTFGNKRGNSFLRFQHKTYYWKKGK